MGKTMGRQRRKVSTVHQTASKSESQNAAGRTPPVIWGLLIGVLLVAGALRWINFRHFPPGLWYDEVYTLEGARRIVDEGQWPLYYPDKHGEPAIFWLTALALKLGGGALSPRWVSSIGGLAGVALLFFAIRDVWRRAGPAADWLALGGASVLAVNYVYLFYTRMSWQQAVTTPLVILTVWFFWRGLAGGRLRDFAIAGTAAGAAQYGDVSARLLPLVCLLILGGWLAAREREGWWWARWRGLLVMGGCALLVYAPLARTFLTHPEWFTHRLKAAAAKTNIIANIGRTLGGWLWLGDAGLHGLPGRPIYLWPLGALLVLGCGTALWRARRPAYTVWLAWFLGCLPGSFLSDPAPIFYRILIALPASAALCAIGGHTVWMGLTARFPRRKLLAGGLLAGALAFSLGATIYDYFVRYARWDQLFYVMDVGKWRAAEVIQAAPADEMLFVTMPERFEVSLSYGVHTRSVYPRIFDGERCFIYPAATPRPAHYVVIQGYEQRSLAYLNQLFPHLTPAVDPVFAGKEPYFVEVTIPADTPLPIMGALEKPLTYGEIALWGIHVPSKQLPAGQTLDVTLTWRAPQPTAASYTIFVHLLDGSPEAVETPLRAQHDTIPCLNTAPTQTWQPDEYVVEVHSLSIPADLTPGAYLLGIGVYDSATMERMIPDNARVQWNEAIVDTITVTTP